MGSTVVAYMHRDEWTHSFGKSLTKLIAANHGGHIVDVIDARCNTGDLPNGRNRAMSTFLEGDHEWLFFIDTDMGFQEQALAGLHAVADPVERPIVGGLCFAQRDMEHDGRHGYRWEPRPTIFEYLKFPDDKERFSFRTHYPVSGVVQCDATGAAFVLIHRSVGEQIRDRFGEVWFDRIDDLDGLMSEDLSFFSRWMEIYGRGGCHIHTGVRTTHQKPIWLSESDFWARALIPPATDLVDVIVPVLHRPQNVAPFMETLRASTGLATAWFVCDPDDTEEIAAVREHGGRVVKKAGSFAQKVNFAYPKTKAPWIFLAGDDVLFHPGWLDHAELVGKSYGGLVVGTNDLGNPRVMRGDHATHLLIRRSYIDEIGAGWDGPGVVCHEGYRHWFVDDEIVLAAQQREVWQMALGSIVEHMHPLWGKNDDDDVYRLGQSFAVQDRDTFNVRLAEFTDQAGPVSLVGTVVDGHGAAAADVLAGLYDDVIGDAYPGSLNVELADPAILNNLPAPHRVVKHPHGYDLLMWRGVAHDEDVWVMWPNRQPIEPIIELFASVRLRDEWTLETGDKLEVTVTA